MGNGKREEGNGPHSGLVYGNLNVLYIGLIGRICKSPNPQCLNPILKCKTRPSVLLLPFLDPGRKQAQCKWLGIMNESMQPFFTGVPPIGLSYLRTGPNPGHRSARVSFFSARVNVSSA